MYVVVTVQLLDDGRGARVGKDVTNHFDRQLDGALGAREPERPRLNHRGHGNLVLPTVLIQKGMRLVGLSLGKEVCSPVSSLVAIHDSAVVFLCYGENWSSLWLYIYM